jgi:hypothetical protein
MNARAALDRTSADHGIRRYLGPSRTVETAGQCVRPSARIGGMPAHQELRGGRFVAGVGVLAIGCASVLYLAWPESMKRCTDFSTQQQAQAYYAGQDFLSDDYPDIDPDSDGNACEE